MWFVMLSGLPITRVTAAGTVTGIAIGLAASCTAIVVGIVNRKLSVKEHKAHAKKEHSPATLWLAIFPPRFDMGRIAGLFWNNSHPNTSYLC